MRIIGGIAAGRLLRVPDGFDVRPMPDKVKLAVFNSLGDRVVHARSLDLFSGTGALGLETLSRGASSLVSVERSPRHARCYRDNLAATGLPAGAVELRLQDVFVALPKLRSLGRQFELVIADPPYGEKNVGRRSTSLAQRLLDDLDLPALMAPEGLLVLGHARRDTLQIPARWTDRKQLQHGDTVIRFLVPSAVEATKEPGEPGADVTPG
ncbi:MAG: RsmD family RNA methyltransferase [Verrucomicrobiota bacterium]